MKKIALILMSCFLFATISAVSQTSEKKTVKLLKKHIARQNVKKVRRMLDEVPLTKKELVSCFEYADLCFSTYLNEAGASPLVGGLHMASHTGGVAVSGAFSYLLAKALPKATTFFVEKFEPRDDKMRAVLKTSFGCYWGLIWLGFALECLRKAGSVCSLVKQIVHRGNLKKAQTIKQMLLEQKGYSS